MYHCLKKGSRVALLALLLTALPVPLRLMSPGENKTAIAQQVTPQQRADFLSDPLEDDPLDPLLPVLTVERAYSPLERQTIATRLDELNLSAARLLEQGQSDTAFAEWIREARLRRILGPTEEYAAIRRLAPIAWAQQRPTEIQLLTLRTRQLWEAIQASLGTLPEADFPPTDEPDSSESLITGAPTADAATLSAFAETFATLRDLDSTVAVYEQLIDLSPDDSEQQRQQQVALAELYLTWFRFGEGANLYRQLLIDLRNPSTALDGARSSNPALEVAYLERLVYSYEQADSRLNAVRAQTDLIPFYQADRERLPALLLAIAQNYRQLNLPNNAISYYRSAYSAAQRFEQFSFSAQVLQDLGSLYRSLGMTREALQAYELLIPVEQQAYNDYGQMSAHDLIGQLYRQQGNNREALIAFERALVLANRLGLPDGYYIEQIESVTP